MRPADRRLALAFLGVGAVLAPVPAQAACTISTVGVAFGAYDSLGAAPDDGTGSVNADCHPSDQSPVVSLSAGLYGSYAMRRMSSGSDELDYNLYADVNRTIVWGDGSAGSQTVTLTNGIVTAGTRRFIRTIYGRIPAGQQASFGSYADTLVVTITF